MRIARCLHTVLMCLPVGLAAAATQSSTGTTLPKPQHCEVTGHFVQHRSVSGLPVPLESSGIFYQDCNAGLIWKTTAPVQESMVVTLNHEVLLGTGGDLIPATSRSAELIAELIQGLLAGHNEKLSRNFSIEVVSSTEQAKQLFLLTPISGAFKRALQEIEVHFSGQNNDLREVTVVVTDRSANLTRIEVHEAPERVLPAANGGCLKLDRFTTQECQALTTENAAPETTPEESVLPR